MTETDHETTPDLHESKLCNNLTALPNKAYDNSIQISESDNDAQSDDQNHSDDPGYEKIPHDKNLDNYNYAHNDSLGDMDYEQFEDGYESIKKSKSDDPGYETITGEKDEEPDYEIIRPRKYSSCSGRKDSLCSTRKDSLCSTRKDSTSSGRYSNYKTNTQIPDFLRNIDKKPDKGSINLSWHGKIVPAEILALYAKVDKSKKAKNRKTVTQSTDNLTREEENEIKSQGSPSLILNIKPRRYPLSSINFFSDSSKAISSSPSEHKSSTYLSSSNCSLDSEPSSSSPHSQISVLTDTPTYLSSARSTPTSPCDSNQVFRPLPPIPSETDRDLTSL